jgi:hypothetical protein
MNCSITWSTSIPLGERMRPKLIGVSSSVGQETASQKRFASWPAVSILLCPRGQAANQFRAPSL